MKYLPITNRTICVCVRERESHFVKRNGMINSVMSVRYIDSSLLPSVTTICAFEKNGHWLVSRTSLYLHEVGPLIPALRARLCMWGKSECGSLGRSKASTI